MSREHAEMFGVHFGTAFRDAARFGAAAARSAPTGVRRVALLATGRRHGDITRLITPWAVGELTTPFVFLDYAQVAPEARLRGIQPHADIATLTVVLSGAVSFADSNGRRGAVRAGGCAWMRAAHGAWRGGGSASGEPLRVFQLWIALPASPLEAAVASEGVAPDELETDGPVRVVLGQSGTARSRIRGAPADVNCFHVSLRDGDRWRYAAPAGHNVTWLAVDRGSLLLAERERLYWQQLAVYGDRQGLIEVEAAGDTSFLLGSAARQPRAPAPDTHTVAAPFAAIVQEDTEPARAEARRRVRRGG
jgi:redox-sensitive bicupin YhaK (pirin superfamily)